MNFDSVWPLAPSVSVIFGVVAVPSFRAANTAPQAGARHRLHAMDGLRGLLALMVFYHHAAIYHQYLVTGEWLRPASRVYQAPGPTGVSMFLIITGYVFWGRLPRELGRPAWRALDVGRLFRIVPLYLVAILRCLCWSSQASISTWLSPAPRSPERPHAGFAWPSLLRS